MRTLTKRIEQVEAATNAGEGVNWAAALVEHRYQVPRIYNRAQLEALAAEDDLNGKVARGLLRIARSAEDAPRVKFDGEAELVRTLASLYADPMGWVMFAFDWGNDGALRLVPLPEDLQLIYSAEHGLDRWGCNFLQDLGGEVAGRPFDRKTAVPAVRMAISSGHSIGKTMLQSMLMLWAISTREHCRGVATSTTSTQLHTRLWPEMLAWLGRSIIAPFFDTLNAKGSMRLFHREHQNTWRFDGATAAPENSEAFAGLHNATSSTVFLLDEASGIDARIWRAIEGSMVDGAPLLIAVGNPTRRDGEFYRIFTDGAHRWNLRRVDSREAFLTNKDQIEAWRQDWGDDSDFFRVRVKGEFPSQSLAQFIPADVVAEARKRDVAPINMQDAPILAVDPARFGTDSSCIAIRVGRNARDLPSRQYRGLDTRQLSMEVARLANELRTGYHFQAVHIVVDGIGIGAGVVDTLRGMGFDVVDVQAAGRATDYRTYLNVRAELYGRMKDWLQSGGAIEDHDELAEDLTAGDYLFTSKGLLQLEPKDAIRARLGRSPDRADALAMTFAVEPAMTMMNSREQIFMDEYRARRRAERDNYDPIGGVADNVRRGLDWEPEAFKARQ